MNLQTSKKSNKMAAFAVSLLLLSSVALTYTSLPVTNAHQPSWSISTWCYIAAQNNPIGVNQEVLIIFWLNSPPPTAQGAYGDRWKFTIDVTQPDGSKETLGPFTSDPVGGAYALYTPTQVGTYTIVAQFPDTVITGLPLNPNPAGGQSLTNVNDTYLSSTSDPIDLVVQQEPIHGWSETPLPTQYWMRPINSANRDWDVLAGNWLVPLKT
ncbi:MAG: hypothetical protein NWF00_02480 [Candidatus Bathyarchaeota archaeon]|nr:hypothetical protein [Candidatus Bathyarchaeota archaeon]